MNIRAEVSEIRIDVQGHMSRVRSDKFWLFGASEWHRQYKDYVPMDTGHLYENVNITPGAIEHNMPYSRYVYYAETYGANIPIVEHDTTVGFLSRKGKPKYGTGRSMRFKTQKHPKACAKWDKAAEPTKKPLLIDAMQAFVDAGGLGFGR